ncbi:MAG: class I SAM-dependent methyltransferase [Candidatus Omnitrophica bacterium]|nr:class I SAM-dependent methyltransferase [Candidatus Omnitrophota bacterium]
MDIVKTEFDNYAKGYSGGMEDPLKRMVGKDLEAFLRIKAEDLLRTICRKECSVRDTKIVLLDFGCGQGDFLRILRELGSDADLEGCDISEGMLEEAKKKWTSGSAPVFFKTNYGEAPSPREKYDVIVIVSVLHHVPPEKRQKLLSDVSLSLKKGGLLAVFEHNPYNPLTSIVVKRAAIDKNAVMLTGSECAELMSSAGLKHERTNYILFFPLWKWAEGFRKIEPLLWWLPVGGQYCVYAKKP